MELIQKNFLKGLRSKLNDGRIMVLVSIIISTHNKKNELRRTIESIRESTMVDLEIIVVSAASNDGTDEFLPKEFPDVKLVIAPDVGWGESNNIGAANANGEFLFFSGADLQFMDQWLEKLVSCSKKLNNYGSLGTIVNRTENGIDKYTGGMKVKFGGLINPVLEIKEEIQPFCEEYVTDNCIFYPVDCVYYPFVRRDTFLKSGGFDPEYFYWNDDVDFGLKLERMGLNNYIINFYGMKTEATAVSEKLVYYFHRNKLRLILKTNSFPTNLLFGCVETVLFLGYAIIYYVRRKRNFSKLILSGIIWNFRNLKSTMRAKKLFFKV